MDASINTFNIDDIILFIENDRESLNSFSDEAIKKLMNIYLN